MAQTLYTPERLIESRKKVEALHVKEDAYNFASPEEDLELLIRRLLDTQDTMVPAAGLCLSDREACMLAGYLPHNYYEVSEDKLFLAMKKRLDDDSCEVLFEQWQEEFDNYPCNHFLRELSEKNPYFQKTLEKHHIKPALFIQILISRNIPLAFDQLLIGAVFADGMEFERKLQYYGITPQSFLDVECKRALLTFCEKEDYFSCSEENLLDIIKTYDSYMLKKFLFNFLDKLSLSELEYYPALASYMRKVTGHRNSRTFQQFFEEASDGQVQQFVDWINVFKLNAYFEEDERSQFWKQFRYLNVVRYPVSNVVIMEFDECVAIEFLGEKKGTIYICDKEIFMQNFYNQLDRMDNEELRGFFKSKKDLCIESRSHVGRWQAHISNLLIKQDIAEKIKR